MLSARFVEIGDAPGFADIPVVGDFDGDGDLDVAAGFAGLGNNGVNILRNNGAGVLEAWQDFDGAFSLVAAVDFDGDMDLDLVGLGVLFRNTGGAFGAPETLNANAITAFGFAADANGDGLPDLFVDNGLGAFSLYLNVAGGALADPVLLPSPGAGARLRAVVDMTGDGLPDLVYASGASAVVYRADAGSYVPLGALAAGFDSAPVVADINGDGAPDLVWANGRLVSALNNGDGTFGDPVVSGADRWTSVSAVADFDGDGRADVIGIRDAFTFALVGASFGAGDGTFGSVVSPIYGFDADTESTPGVFAAELTGDSRSDVMRVSRPAAAPGLGELTVYRSAPAPLISIAAEPGAVVTPGRRLPVVITTEPGEGADVVSVRVFRDSNANGVYDTTDEVVGDAVLVGSTWELRNRSLTACLPAQRGSSPSPPTPRKPPAIPRRSIWRYGRAWRIRRAGATTRPSTSTFPSSIRTRSLFRTG